LILLSVSRFSHFVFGLGEAVAAGDGLEVGLGLVTGAVPVALAGEGDVAGDDLALLGDDVVFGEVLSGSAAQPTAKAIARTIGSSRLMRMVSFVFGLLIVCLVRARWKSTPIVVLPQVSSNGCSHRV
jgi:hypothetical protein